MRFTINSSLTLFMILSGTAYGQEKPNSELPNAQQAMTVQSTTQNHWYEKVSLRGYTQLRYNRLLETNENLGCEQCDKSWGKGGGFFMRRIRLVFYGQLSQRIYIYVQPDFASAPSSDKLNFAQIRDAYADLGIDKHNEFRFRIGQSKIPYGFENMQSSQNRLPLDRNDGMNSAMANERDMGVFFYWAPSKIRKRFSDLVKMGLKGSGDYGVFGFGVFNGQTSNNPELNDEPHVVARLTYPFLYKKQFVEASIQAYSGKYVIPTANLSKGVRYVSGQNYIDQRIAASLIVYPQPFGLQAEYNIGRGPEFNKNTDSIEVQNLQGGYMMLNCKTAIRNQLIYPFIRAQYYDGGKKHERDARSYTVKELELGIEWSPIKYFELVAMYTFSDRRYEDFINRDNHQKGRLLRLQAQLNF